MLQEFQGTPQQATRFIKADLSARRDAALGGLEGYLQRAGYSTAKDLQLDTPAIASAHEAVKSVAGLFTQGETLAASTTSGERFPVAHAEYATLPPSSPAADKPTVKSKA